jgi:hypothetical protein
MDDELARPTFHELRLKHGISLEAISVYAGPSLSMEEIRLFDETGRANPYTADDLLFVLSKLSGQRYSRTNVGEITLVLARPPASPTHPQPLAGALFSRLTLLELYVAYALDLDWLAEALGKDTYDVWQLMAGPTDQSNYPAVEEFLHLVSRYTGVDYTLDATIIGRQTAAARPLFSSVPG